MNREARIAAGVALAVAGLTVGGLLAVLLPFLLWPGGATAGLLVIQERPSPEDVRGAELAYGLILGGVGAVVPAVAFRLGYALAALLVVFGAAADYWARHDVAMPVLFAALAWLAVAGAMWLLRTARRPPGGGRQATRDRDRRSS